ncbi:uncharacterized protein C8R40DRAFT_1073904 [Lentinula edodes]|uniref:uncharacterized protein n=1 Tax=Lentinula edodes TaxID=5353 RepID=UPI001E8E2699|nr:uncharacterized protein C8R40DRAFT_1073904 [Lentinula edodes]KAH7869575.1 hypothetical protein C8R40DRAFT_1073904 [Lentinula edodes]
MARVASPGISSNDGDGGYQNRAWSAPEKSITRFENRRLTLGTRGVPRNHPGKCDPSQSSNACRHQEGRKENNLNHRLHQGDGDGSKGVLVTSQLHDALTITTDNDTPPLFFWSDII